MKKARWEGQDVEMIRAANANDPGFDQESKVLQVLIRDGEGKKHVVNGTEVLISAADMAELQAAPEGVAGVAQTPPKDKK